MELRLVPEVSLYSPIKTACVLLVGVHILRILSGRRR
jgi:hypothetical protein